MQPAAKAPLPAPLDRPANSNDAAKAASRDSLMRRTGLFLQRLDDATLLRWLFRIILFGAVVVLALDLRQIRESAPDVSAYPEPYEVPVLPPALTDGTPEAPPFEITTSPETLRQAMRFELQPGGILAARGAIDVGAAERFAAEIAERGEYVDAITLDSPGGSVDDALAMSALIRENGFATSVAGGALCASSCPIVMAGGVERLAEAEAIIGVHQVYGAGGSIPSPAHAMAEAQATTARVSRHLSEMGIVPGLWLHALETPPDRLYYLTPDEMLEFSLTTPPA